MFLIRRVFWWHVTDRNDPRTSMSHALTKRGSKFLSNARKDVLPVFVILVSGGNWDTRLTGGWAERNVGRVSRGLTPTKLEARVMIVMRMSRRNSVRIGRDVSAPVLRRQYDHYRWRNKNDSQKPWHRDSDTAENNAKARKAYEALMTVTLRKPTSPEYRKFSEQVKERAADMYPNFTYGEEEVNSFVGAFHDAVLLYALALNETLAANGSISDGVAITRRMWNRTFEGITGNVSIDANGDRNADYSLLDMNSETGVFEVVANYYGNKKEYEPVAGKSIHWAGGRTGPPPDTPKCEPFPEYGIVIIVLGSILLIVIIAVFFIYRHIKLEAELAEMNWRVRWEDILFGSPEKNKRLERQGSKLSLVRKGSCPSSISGDTLAFQLSDAGNRQLFTKTGYYKGAIIAIKTISRTNITVSKPLLLEIKRDVLENDQIKLDWMFRYSIMQDIVRGMAYLHGTEIRSHGNLKSTNCVVDSRFVVKITDFGLHYFRTNPEASEEESAYRNFHNKLWTAPELLRMHSRPPEGTQKGDVYSFAIICQEIVYRNGVFYLHNLDLTPEEIYGKVRNGLKPYFRPTLEEYDCPCDELADVIRRCWAEDQSDRPDFTQLKSIIRKLNRSVALQLIRGESVTAESYDSVSIYFSDICGFTAMSAESTPMQVVDLLNDLYTTFDSIIENFDVYKVETIGDAYMVVSGLPERNGHLHAREIARMSLSLLEAVLSFRIRHRPKEQLKLRIGMHTGPVCCGVVGHKMPRYCLFGDTVNTASRMESNGLPLRIHVSSTCKSVLDRFGVFELESRGEVEMKGKGSMHTYWLLGERPIQESPGTTLNIL
ncbi:hypothetical protein BaRGS_00034589 [Batillaria attramentaria]|uniref:Guanylate cyclase n=1 Tax=Batillaria attramentaria TaxID=370345 RepID=A0ABD0JHP5_9CAEN